MFELAIVADGIICDIRYRIHESKITNFLIFWLFILNTRLKLSLFPLRQQPNPHYLKFSPNSILSLS
jgi:hypothetical protein